MISLGWFQYTRLFSGKENELWDGQSSTSHWVRGERYQYFGARYYDPVACSWTVVDPLAEKYYGITPYVYCAGNPVNYEDLFGKSWRPIKSYNSKGEEVHSGFEWVPEEKSYHENGQLKEGLYHQAIFFSDNQSFDYKSNYNLGSSSAYVFLEDGTVVEFEASTMPSNSKKYATVPEGLYEAGVGTHHGRSSSYTALRLGDLGTKNFSNNMISLRNKNPAHKGSFKAIGINIHKSGKEGLTGMTRDNKPISEGCLLISYSQWDSFIRNFDNDRQRNNTVSVIVSRSFGRPQHSQKIELERIESLPVRL